MDDEGYIQWREDTAQAKLAGEEALAHKLIKPIGSRQATQILYSQPFSVEHIDPFCATLRNDDSIWVFVRDFNNPDAKESGWRLICGVVAGRLLKYRGRPWWLHRFYAEKLGMPTRSVE